MINYLLIGCADGYPDLYTRDNTQISCKTHTEKKKIHGNCAAKTLDA